MLALVKAAESAKRGLGELLQSMNRALIAYLVVWRPGLGKGAGVDVVGRNRKFLLGHKAQQLRSAETLREAFIYTVKSSCSVLA